MAEGWLRHLRPEDFNVHSAGLKAHGLNPLAVRAMAEAGVDIRNQRSKTLDELPAAQMDYVVTVCGHANETCPVLPARVKHIHAGFDDPPKLAANAGSEEEAMTHYRRVRDEIRDFIEHIDDHLK